MMKLLTATLLSVLFLVAVLPLGAQATELKYDHRVTGDRSLTIQLGPIFPEVFSSFGGTLYPTHLTPGATLGIDLDFYNSGNLRLGGGLRGKATFSPNASTLFMVPITFRATWEFQYNHFSFPVGMAAGFSFTNYRTDTSFDPILMPLAGAYWNMTSSWSFGLDASEWIVFQPYLAGGTVPSSDSRIAFFGDVTLAAIYHF